MNFAVYYSAFLPKYKFDEKGKRIVSPPAWSNEFVTNFSSPEEIKHWLNLTYTMANIPIKDIFILQIVDILEQL